MDEQNAVSRRLAHRQNVASQSYQATTNALSLAGACSIKTLTAVNEGTVRQYILVADAPDFVSIIRISSIK